ncbi:MAG: carbohydrate-binding domain-containing protein, partial [Bacteroidaceae bacterium]|nr:carbohydrate-binding domain-containing protein [Bacteroidaceae bacterium]
MFEIKRHLQVSLLCLTGVLMGCTTDNNNFPTPNQWLGDGPEDMPGNHPMGGMEGRVEDDTVMPDIDATIYTYNGQKATDAASDVVGNDKDFYHEKNNFSTQVVVEYNGNNATATTSSPDIICLIEDAHVVVDMLTHSVQNVNIILRGQTENGSLKIYGEKKFMLTLEGVDITSQNGPAINSQCKKRMFVHLVEGTVNSLKDNASYADDFYYMDSVSAKDEDRKGCFFSEGNLIFSGTGVLKVAGLKKHGIATDGYFWMRPGVTIAVTEAQKNAIHVKGDMEDGIGVTINGGLLYTNVKSEAGKGIKCDQMVDINGGELQLNTTGISVYDEEEEDTSSPSCIKADGNVSIRNGKLTLKSTGTGGKGISTDANLYISGGETTITTTGGKYTYSTELTSSPKGIKADGDILISGGKVNICVTGKSDGSEGLESKANLTISDGDICIYAYDDAINAAESITINGGMVYAHSVNNDGIDSNGTLTINGGTVIASGTNVPDGSFDSDDSKNFVVNGGTLIGIGGACTTPSNESKQNSL